MQPMHYLRLLASSGATDIHPGGAASSARLISALRLGSGNTVLEIGCGPGATLVRIAAAHRVRAIGIDLLPEMLAAAARRVRWCGLRQRVSLIHGDATALPIAAGTCDRIYGESVIGFQDHGDPDAMLAEIRRVLKPGGRCVINEAIWRATAGDAEIDDANRRCMSAFGLRQASEARWRADDWILAMRRAGLEVVAQVPDDASIRHEPKPAIPARAILASRAVSLLHQAQSILRRSSRTRLRAYRELLDRHRDIGCLIESRLFILDRPR